MNPEHKAFIALAILGIVSGFLWFGALWIFFWKPWFEDMNRRRKELNERIAKRKMSE